MNHLSCVSIRRFPAARLATRMAVLGAVTGGGFPLHALAQDDASGAGEESDHAGGAAQSAQRVAVAHVLHGRAISRGISR